MSWEYRVLTVDANEIAPEIEERLNEAARENWEFDGLANGLIFLKRAEVRMNQPQGLAFWRDAQNTGI